MGQKNSLRHHKTTPSTIREKGFELGHRESRVDDAVEPQETIPNGTGIALRRCPALYPRHVNVYDDGQYEPHLEFIPLELTSRAWRLESVDRHFVGSVGWIVVDIFTS